MESIKYKQTQPKPENIPLYIQSQNNTLLNSQMHNHPNIVAQRPENQYQYCDFQKERNFRIMDYLNQAEQQMNRELNSLQPGSWEYRKVRSELDNLFRIKFEKQKEFKSFENVKYTGNVPNLGHMKITQGPNVQKSQLYLNNQITPYHYQDQISTQNYRSKQMAYDPYQGFKISIDFVLNLPVELERAKILYGVQQYDEKININNLTDNYELKQNTYRSKNAYIDHKDIIRLVYPDQKSVIYFEIWAQENQQKEEILKRKVEIYTKLWSSFQIFNSQNEFQPGYYKLPVYSMKNNLQELLQSQNTGHGLPQYLDCYLYFRISLANDREIEESYGLNKQDRYITPNEHLRRNHQVKNPFDFSNRQIIIDKDKNYYDQMKNIYNSQKDEINRLFNNPKQVTIAKLPVALNGIQPNNSAMSFMYNNNNQDKENEEKSDRQLMIDQDMFNLGLEENQVKNKDTRKIKDPQYNNENQQYTDPFQDEIDQNLNNNNNQQIYENCLILEIQQIFNFSSNCEALSCNWMLVDEYGVIRNKFDQRMIERDDEVIEIQKGKKNILLNEKHKIPINVNEIMEKKNGRVENCFLILQVSQKTINDTNEGQQLNEFSWTAHQLFYFDENVGNFVLNYGHFTEFLLQPPVLKGEELVTKMNETEMLPDILEFVIYQESNPYLIPVDFPDQNSYLQVSLIQILNANYKEQYTHYRIFISLDQKLPIAINDIPLFVMTNLYTFTPNDQQSKKVFNKIIEDSILVEQNLSFILENFQQQIDQLHLCVEFYKSDRNEEIKIGINQESENFVGKIMFPFKKLSKKFITNENKMEKLQVPILNNKGKKTNMLLDLVLEKTLVSF
ncbi:hypothetical protein PPERSA_01660 [Pseudocohnilembus persalinus]|uniref:Uncharacterized protein n=1 Tax=Pseudocohnilembus persalinus TaxID=266149 RepID=A0A0V0R0V4_PSEPJ|nr:hypothetical protein PPERSA_01660 [Pseudocohnilembus persalinus]|eukprot:KRX08115.1 hypothetical protein PPERSA_01660 [Pseudocohnilembus persalinus]